MKLNIAWRLGIALSLIGVLSAGLTGFYAYTQSRTLLTDAAKDRLLTATHVLARQVSLEFDIASRNARMIADHPVARSLLLKTDQAYLDKRSEAAAMLFKSMLQTYPEYFQIRLISASKHGLERVRVDRSEQGPIRVTGDDLQEKGHYPYVFDTLGLHAGQVYISPAQINHELGAHAGWNKPSVQVASPIADVTGKTIGLVVINIDLDGLFQQLAADLPPGLKLYLANDRGDFLIHPNPEKAFAFDRGQIARVQDSFPATRALLGTTNHSESDLVTSRPAEDQKPAQIAAFVRQPIAGASGSNVFIIGIGQPLHRVLAVSNRMGAISLQIVLAFSVLSIILAIFFARALSRPLKQMVHAVENVGTNRVQVSLPVQRRDEIGVLARTIEAMRRQIRSQFTSLEEKRLELDRLASHDSLTGLPNRRLFYDRLTQAIARAKREQGSLALLYIDLDQFKPINDKLGHAAGDALLQALGQRLKSLVRNIDTVARVGGDEFIILLDGADNRSAIDLLAHQVIQAISKPVQFGAHELVCGASIGISRFPEDAEDMEKLISQADHAMYQAKSSGSGRVVFAGA